MNRRRAFTLVEVLMVMAIVAVLSAIAWSVIQPVKDRAQMSVCASNLRNMYLALSLYREQYDGASQGTAAQMGFPGLWEAANIVKPLPQCSAAPSVVFSKKYPYWIMSHDAHTMFTWQAYVERYGESAYVISDLNHNPKDQPLMSDFGSYRVTAINLMGSLKTSVAAGGWESLGSDFWARN